MPLIFSFWRFQIAAGRKARPVWAIVGGNGYIFGWSVSKRSAAGELPKYITANSDLRLVRICPNG